MRPRSFSLVLGRLEKRAASLEAMWEFGDPARAHSARQTAALPRDAHETAPSAFGRTV